MIDLTSECTRVLYERLTEVSAELSNARQKYNQLANEAIAIEAEIQRRRTVIAIAINVPNRT